MMLSSSFRDSRVVQWIAVALALATPGAQRRLVAEETHGGHTVNVGRQMQALVESDWVDCDRRFAAARAEPGHGVRINAQGVTTSEDASGAVDGVKNGRFGFHVAVGEKDPWWQVDLGRNCRLDRVVIYNRTDGGCAPRTRYIGIQVASDQQRDRFVSVYQHDGTTFYGAEKNQPLVVNLKDQEVTARIVRLSVSGTCHLALDEVEVYGAADPETNIALGRPADQKSVSRHSVSGTADEASTAVAAR